MRFASLGSGSRGNATLVEDGNTLLLIDNGFSVKETVKRLARLNRQPENINAILVTHEHGDHVSGVGRLAKKYRLPVWSTEGTRRAAEKALDGVVQFNCFNTHEVFSIEDFQIHPITVPHDAREPSQFVFNNGNKRLGVLTDTGSITPHIVSMLDNCNALILESNHDDQMLAQSLYPQHLKQRIAGRLGHLANQQSAELLSRLDTGQLQQVVAAHLSEQNNSIARVRTSLASALGCEESWLQIANQEEGISWRDC